MPSKLVPIRSIIKAPPGKLLVELDLAQAESWVVAFSANEPNMKHALQFGDIHKLTASVLFNVPEDQVTKDMRYNGKQCNHALAYRMSPQRFVQVYNMNASKSKKPVISLRQAREYHARWHEFYNLKSWWWSIEEKLKQDRTLTTIYGRRRIFYGWLNDEMFKEGTASVPQSTIGDHAAGAVQPELGIEGGLLGIWKYTKSKKDVTLIQTAHDSAVLEVPAPNAREVLDEIVPLFRRPMLINGELFTVPVDAKIGEVWGELEEVKLAS